MGGVGKNLKKTIMEQQQYGSSSVRRNSVVSQSMSPEEMTKTAGPTTQTTNMSMMMNNQFVPNKAYAATVATKDGAGGGTLVSTGEDTNSGAVNLRKTCLTGIRSAGFFSRTQGTTNVGTSSNTEGTFRYKETKNGKEEFASRNSLQNRRTMD